VGGRLISFTKFIGDSVDIRNTYEVLNIMEKCHQFVLQVSLSIGEYKSNFWDGHGEKKNMYHILTNAVTVTDIPTKLPSLLL